MYECPVTLELGNNPIITHLMNKSNKKLPAQNFFQTGSLALHLKQFILDAGSHLFKLFRKR